jgi:pimeloyl-ACP methyl ester carboxylesterase
MIPKFVDFRKVVERSIVGLGGSKPDSERILILVGELDVFMDVRTMHRLAKRYREAVRHSIGENEEGRVSSFEGHEVDGEQAYMEDRGDGVRMVVVKGAGHHVQNDLQWEVGAQRVVDFLQQL